ncbi:unnamed protein product [Pedinophyceae sp. YPF-701]|nr:unnamed protein product [Pedinophyceae sp. YPF-701]
MTDVSQLPIPGGFDPLSEGITTLDENTQANESSKQLKGSSEEYIHIRVQQRNGRKSLTTIQGLATQYDKKKILKALRKDFCCNGAIIEDPKYGQVIQLQGDQRKNVATFLVDTKITKKDMIKIHGF